MADTKNYWMRLKNGIIKYLPNQEIGEDWIQLTVEEVQAHQIVTGDYILGYGIIYAIDATGATDKKFWSGKPNVTFFDPIDPYYGACSTWLRPDCLKRLHTDMSYDGDNYFKVTTEVALKLVKQIIYKSTLKRLKDVNDDIEWVKTNLMDNGIIKGDLHG